MNMKAELVPQGPRGIAYQGPALIKAADAPRFLWGDRKAGYVSDWIYGSSPNIHMMSFEMNVGLRFGNSPDFKTYYNCAETYHCLKGEFTFHCPETGEVHVMRKGDTLYFPPNTWHWGYNFGSETCRILESLTPRTEEAVEAYAIKQPWLKEVLMGPAGIAGNYLPGGQTGPQRAKLVRPGDYTYLMEGEDKPLRVGLVCSTEILTTAIVDLHPAQESELRARKSDQALYCLSGRMNVYLPDVSPNWWALSEGDAGFIPADTRHAYFNTSDAMAKFIFSVAPSYD